MALSKIAIIGAGMAGLSAARALRGLADITLFDKSRGVSGRMSTRYTETYEFDHGAQYFTVSDTGFQNLIADAAAQSVVAPWPGRALYLKTGALVSDTGRARWVGTPRMNSFAKYLAQGLDIKLGWRVSSLSRADQTWRLAFENGENLGGFDHVICAVPSPQAALLMPDSFKHRAALRAVKMQACFALMVGLNTELDFGWDSLRINDLPVGWMAVNSTKPARVSGQTTLMIHSTPDWSDANTETDRDAVQAVLLDVASALTGQDLSKADYLSLHRWLYASVAKGADTPCLDDPALGLTLAGDWCLGGRVEGAYLSGQAAAQSVIARLS